LSGNVFEFLRDKRFNATNPFALVGPDGKRKDDGLRRNQFGGTVGGPIVRNKLFFFGAYQGTRVRVTPTDNIAWVPSAAMMAGDFTAFALPACNGGRQVNLTGGFVNNRIDPARFSPAAVNLAKRLPATTDPCGQVKYAAADDSNEGQGVAKIDYQWSANHSLFGRYMATFFKKPAPFSTSENILATGTPGLDNLPSLLPPVIPWCSAPTRSTRFVLRSIGRPSTAATPNSSIPVLWALTSTVTTRGKWS